MTQNVESDNSADQADAAARPDSRDVVERVEPRCRVCRDSAVRAAVNDLLRWRGVPLIGAGTETLEMIHRSLQPLNDSLPPDCKITYNSLWVHATRHYGIDNVTTYLAANIGMMIAEGVRAEGCPDFEHGYCGIVIRKGEVRKAASPPKETAARCAG